MKKLMIIACIALVIMSTIHFTSLRTQSERSYSEIRSDYLTQGTTDEKFGFITGLNKIEFFTFFTHSSFVRDILLPIATCASGNEVDSERCQALLVAIIRKTGEQALSYYAQYAQLMALMDRPYQMIRVLQDMYANDPKKIANALHQLVVANPALALINFKGDVAGDFGVMQYALLKYAAAELRNPASQTWMPLLREVSENWKRTADVVIKSKIIDFSAQDIITLAQLDDFEIARVKAINPSPLLTTEGLAFALAIKV